MLLEGIFPPVTTCFYPDGRPYWRKLEHNVERYSRSPVSGLVLLGSTGEAVMLSDDESREALRIAREAAAPEKVLIAGVGRESVLETLRLAEAAAQLDYDAVLVRTPHFYRPQMGEKEMLTFYQAVADRSPLPVLLYNIPAYTSYELPVSVVGELAYHPNILGIKDSSGHVERIAQLVEATRQGTKRTVAVTSVFAAVTGRMLAQQRDEKTSASGLIAAGELDSGAATVIALPVAVEKRPPLRTRQVGFQVLYSQAQSLHSALEAGATGGVIGMATFAPQAVHEIYTAWKDRDVVLAQEKEQRAAAAEDQICRGMGIPGIKYALDWNGYYGGRARLPLLPLDGDSRRRVEELLQDLRN